VCVPFDSHSRAGPAAEPDGVAVDCRDGLSVERRAVVGEVHVAEGARLVELVNGHPRETFFFGQFCRGAASGGGGTGGGGVSSGAGTAAAAGAGVTGAALDRQAPVASTTAIIPRPTSSLIRASPVCAGP